MATVRLERIRRPLTSALGLLSQSVDAFREDRARRLSAGLAYYAVFALVPALMTSVFIAARIVGDEAAQGTLSEGIVGAVGPDLAMQIEDAIGSAWDSANASQFALFSLLVAAYTGSMLFVAWRDTLELIWDVPFVSDMKNTVLRRVYGMLIPVGVGIVLAGLVIVQTVVGLIPELSRFALIDATLRIAGTVLPAITAVAALACLYRYSTRAARPAWRHVAQGAVVAWVGLALLSWGFGLYLKVIGTTSFAGAASSIVVGLVLLYYGAQILLFGGEVVRCAVERHPRTSWPVERARKTA